MSDLPTIDPALVPQDTTGGSRPHPPIPAKHPTQMPASPQDGRPPEEPEVAIRADKFKTTTGCFAGDSARGFRPYDARAAGRATRLEQP